ncbi:MAG: outer membrane lipoprotein-sorting protein [bacterium]|nr:outer membrane lipoprotein-sorting protein [bacterium]
MRRKFLLAIILICFITITQSLAFATTPKELIDKINVRTKEIKDSYIDIRMSMSVTGMSSGSTQTTKLTYRLKIESITNPTVVRITYLEPDTFKGTVMLVDSEKKLLSMYSPMTNQVVQSKIEESQNDTSSINLTDPTSIFADLEKTYDLTIEEKKIDKKDVYILTATLKQNQKGDFGKGIFYIEKNSLNPVKIELFDTKGQSIGIIDILDIKYNIGLKVATLRSFPKDAKVIKGGTIQGTPGFPFGSQSGK